MIGIVVNDELPLWVVESRLCRTIAFGRKQASVRLLFFPLSDESMPTGDWGAAIRPGPLELLRVSTLDAIAP